MMEGDVAVLLASEVDHILGDVERFNREVVGFEELDETIVAAAADVEGSGGGFEELERTFVLGDSGERMLGVKPAVGDGVVAFGDFGGSHVGNLYVVGKEC
jgi:hypothetical protein